jgi:predicted enzyme related to lactoylglutathione lyase
MAMAHTHGRFVWYELMTSDMAAAETFYTEVVGWKTQAAGVEGVAYTMFTVDGRPVSGAMSLPDSARSMGIPPLWLGYIAVDDVDTLAADIVIDGGVVHRAAADIPGIGRFAIVGDPQGAAFALFKGTSRPEPPAPQGTPGHIGWHELYAADSEGAFTFYSNAFGWQLSRDFDMGPMGVYKIFGLDGSDMGGMMVKPPSMQAPSWTFYFNVPAIDAAAERVTSSGGTIINGPMEVPGGTWIVQCLDPQGAMFALSAATR